MAQYFLHLFPFRQHHQCAVVGGIHRCGIVLPRLHHAVREVDQGLELHGGEQARLLRRDPVRILQPEGIEAVVRGLSFEILDVLPDVLQRGGAVGVVAHRHQFRPYGPLGLLIDAALEHRGGIVAEGGVPLGERGSPAHLNKDQEEQRPPAALFRRGPPPQPDQREQGHRSREEHPVPAPEAGHLLVNRIALPERRLARMHHPGPHQRCPDDQNSDTDRAFQHARPLGHQRGPLGKGARCQHRSGQSGEPLVIAGEAEQVQARHHGPEDPMYRKRSTEGGQQAKDPEDGDHIFHHGAPAENGQHREQQHQHAHIAVRHGGIGAEPGRIGAHSIREEVGPGRVPSEGVHRGIAVGHARGPRQIRRYLHIRVDRTDGHDQGEHGEQDLVTQQPEDEGAVALAPCAHRIHDDQCQQQPCADEGKSVVSAREQQALEDGRLHRRSPRRPLDQPQLCADQPRQQGRTDHRVEVHFVRGEEAAQRIGQADDQGDPRITSDPADQAHHPDAAHDDVAEEERLQGVKRVADGAAQHDGHRVPRGAL